MPERKLSASKGEMTVREAGHKGGTLGGKKGGETTLERYGPQFYEEIGKKGGNKVRELIAEGKRARKRS